MEAFLALVYDCINQTALSSESKKYLGQLIAQALALYIEIVISVSDTVVRMYEALKMGVLFSFLVGIGFMLFTIHCILVEKAKKAAVKDYVEHSLREEVSKSLYEIKFAAGKKRDTSTEK